MQPIFIIFYTENKSNLLLLCGRMRIIDRIMYMYLKKIISLAFCTVLLVELCIAYNSEFIHATLNKKAIVFHCARDHSYENM